MKLQDLYKTHKRYVIIHKDTKELLFQDRLFNNTTSAKTAFYQKMNRYSLVHTDLKHLYGKRFSEQGEYITQTLDMTLQEGIYGQ